MLTPRSALTGPGAAPEREEGKRHLIAWHRLVNSGGAGATAPPGVLRAAGGGPPTALLIEGAQRWKHRAKAALPWGWGAEGQTSTPTPPPSRRAPSGARGPPGSHRHRLPRRPGTARAPTPSKRSGSGQRHFPTRLLFARLGGGGFEVGNRWEEGFPTVGRGE